MKGYKLTARGKSLVSGLIILLLFVSVTVFFLVAGTSGISGGSQTVAPPTITTDPPQNAGNFNPPENQVSSTNGGYTEPAENGEVNGGTENGAANGDVNNGTYNDYITIYIENGESHNEVEDPGENGEGPNEIEYPGGNGDIENDTEPEENGEQNQGQDEVEELDLTPTFDEDTGTLTLYISSASDGVLDDATSEMLNEFLSLPQNNPEHVILVTTPLLEMDELVGLSEVMINILRGRDVPHDRIVFTTSAQNLRTQNPTFEVSLSFLQVRPK